MIMRNKQEEFPTIVRTLRCKSIAMLVSLFLSEATHKRTHTHTDMHTHAHTHTNTKMCHSNGTVHNAIA